MLNNDVRLVRALIRKNMRLVRVHQAHMPKSPMYRGDLTEKEAVEEIRLIMSKLRMKIVSIEKGQEPKPEPSKEVASV